MSTAATAPACYPQNVITDEQFALAYTSGYRRVKNALAHLGCHSSLLDDFTQDGWLRAWQKRDQYRGGSFSSWVITITVRLWQESFRPAQRWFPGQ